jgi:hypothetical protein
MAQGGGIFVKFRAHEVLLHRPVAKSPSSLGNNVYATLTLHVPTYHPDIMQYSPVPNSNLIKYQIITY